MGAKYGKIDADQVLPSRITIAKETEDRANAVRDRLRDELANIPYLAASTDLWTDEKTSTTYNTINVAYIDGNWKQNSRVIGTKPLNDRHTGANLLSAMRQNLDALGCWRQDGSHIKYVTDNAANNKLAFQGRGRGWQSCFCHNMNLVMQEAMRDTPEVSEMVDAAKKLVKFSKKSNVNSLLKKSDSNARGLKACVPTRWNSEWTMLESILHAHTALTTLAGVAEREEVGRQMELLDKEDLEAVVGVLQFFNEASKKLSASSQPTGFLVPLVLEHARRHLQPGQSDRRIVRKLKANLLRGMTGEKFGGKVGDEQYLALALHPRYRRLQQLPQLTTEKREEIQQLLKTEAIASCLQRAEVVSGDAPVAEPVPSTSSAAAPGSAFSLDLEAMADEDDPADIAEDGNPETRARATVEHEYATYLLDKTGKECKTGEELLDYWSKNEAILPNLAAVARKIHSTPASSAKAERTFSEAGQIIEKRRTRLLSSRVEDLLLIKDNRDLLK